MFQMEGKIDKFMGKCNKQLQAVGSIKRKLKKTKRVYEQRKAWDELEKKGHATDPKWDWSVV